MIQINPIEVLFWNIRRNERDVINVYDKLAPIMQLGTDSNMLNFGLWDKDAKEPLEAQKRMCEFVSDFGNFQSSRKLLDIGSGYGAAALVWKDNFPELQITCLDLNFNQLNQDPAKTSLELVNCTSTSMPIENNSFDTIIALESAHHFKPLEKFFLESKRILSDNGTVILAIPVTENQKLTVLKLGILNLTWTSQHYSEKFVESKIENAGFKIQKVKEVGTSVYEPLADYYINNREQLKERFADVYSKKIESVIFRSMEKMKKISQQKIIKYLIYQLKPV
jgi:cyclopropane fatty-acyl-phospholipid synthase-like methyltransferase